MAEKTALQPSTWPREHDREHDEHSRAEAIMLFVVVDTPTAIIDEVLDTNMYNFNDEPWLWLADPDIIPDIKDGPSGTEPPISRDWRSRFIGFTMEECYEWYEANLERLPWFIDSWRFVVLNGGLKERGTLKVCRYIDKDSRRRERLDNLEVGTHGMSMHVADVARFITFEDLRWDSFLHGGWPANDKPADPEWYKQAMLKAGVAESDVDVPKDHQDQPGDDINA